MHDFETMHMVLAISRFRAFGASQTLATLHMPYQNEAVGSPIPMLPNNFEICAASPAQLAMTASIGALKMIATILLLDRYAAVWARLSIAPSIR